MTVREALNSGTITMLERELLLAHVVGKDRTWTTVHPEAELLEDQIDAFQVLLKRRESGEPIAYIIKRKEFYGRDFMVDPSVLIPRPSTEGLIDLVRDLLGAKKALETRDLDTDIVGISRVFGDRSDVQTIVDIGTGSGCIAVTLACEFPDLHLIATDTSNDALKVAKNNAQAHHVDDRVTFLKGENLDPLSDCTEPFLIVSNPPYIPESEVLMRDVADFEPHTALFAEDHGMAILKEILHQAKNHKWCKGVVFECRKEQERLL